MKIISLFSTLLIVLSLSGCNKENTSSSSLSNSSSILFSSQESISSVAKEEYDFINDLEVISGEFSFKEI